ncbi:hypothetical protein ACFWMU_03410 [Streptomyces sp. NPDC058357]|uniref:hypothetical protein n=1 Tax=unclassified Streptomyces TaxID=2593676 RepID=UPI00365F0EB9
MLLSDALANTGEGDADAILERIGSARRDHGITLFGVGQALRGERLPDAPGLGELASRARKLASATEDGSVRKPATMIGQAARLKGGSGDGGSGEAPEGELD